MGAPSGQAWGRRKLIPESSRRGVLGAPAGLGLPQGKRGRHPPGIPPCVLPLVPRPQAGTQGTGSPAHVGSPSRPSGLGSKGRLRFIQGCGGRQVRGHDPVTQRPLEIVGKRTRCRPWEAPGSRAVLSSERSRVSGERMSRSSRTSCLGCRLVLAPGINEGGGLGEEGEGGPASPVCRVSAWWAGGRPFMSPRSARPRRAVPAGQQDQEGKPASTEVGDHSSDRELGGPARVGRGVVLWAGAWSCGRGVILRTGAWSMNGGVVCGWGRGVWGRGPNGA